MFYSVKVLIGRAVVSLDRPFEYITYDKTIKKGMRVVVSFGNSPHTVGFVMEDPVPVDMQEEEYFDKIGVKLSTIQERIDEVPLLDDNLIELAKRIASYYCCDLMKVLFSFLPPSLKPKDSALSKGKGREIIYVFLNKEEAKEKEFNANEKKIIDLLSLHDEGIPFSRITAKVACKKLVEKEIARFEKIDPSRIPDIVASSLREFSLTNAQRKAYEEIKKNEGVTLLKGVTGSGKTEIYMELAREYLKQGKGVLILIPEISLTSQMADRFYSFFGETISILNSSLSDTRRYKEYMRIQSGETKVVLATRSGIFSPVQNLGLIIIDEEHSNTYKQDNAPYYDAITVSQMRGEIEGCKVILGSATPRIVDMAKAKKGIFHLVELNERYSFYQEKELITVDMNRADSYDPSKSALISTVLYEEIKKNLQNKEQCMILLNRRGYSPMYTCKNCHSVLKCPNCGVPLNYHKKSEDLRCHHCGFRIRAQEAVCDKCKSHEFSPLGFGTERAYSALVESFPDASIMRIDSDINGKEREDILRSFAMGETDILVGTQMISKGHDFPNVTLAALLDADSSLRFPTYLAAEETFSLISQFVGRAGRKDKKGRVLIQTYCPGNTIIEQASKQDYDSFYEYEIQERRKLQYPPYVYLAVVSIRALTAEIVNKASYQIRDLLLEKVGSKRINIYGPSAPFIPHINRRFYRNILLKYKSQEEARELLSYIKVYRMAHKDVQVEIDVDPGMEGI